jgi:hypothetical protein
MFYSFTRDVLHKVKTIYILYKALWFIIEKYFGQYHMCLAFYFEGNTRRIPTNIRLLVKSIITHILTLHGYMVYICNTDWQ